MLDAAHPRDGAFDAHAKAGVRNAAVAAKIEIPFEGRLIEVVMFELLFEIFERRGAFAAADDLAVAFGREQVDAERTFGTVFIDFEIKSLDRGREVMNEHRLAVLI